MVYHSQKILASRIKKKSCFRNKIIFLLFWNAALFFGIKLFHQLEYSDFLSRKKSWEYPDSFKLYIIYSKLVTLYNIIYKHHVEDSCSYFCEGLFVNFKPRPKNSSSHEFFHNVVSHSLSPTILKLIRDSN